MLKTSQSAHYAHLPATQRIIWSTPVCMTDRRRQYKPEPLRQADFEGWDLWLSMYGSVLCLPLARSFATLEVSFILLRFLLKSANQYCWAQAENGCQYEAERSFGDIKNVNKRWHC